MAESVATPQARLARLVGGPRGVVEGGLPPVTFVVTNALASARVGDERGLAFALGAALAAALALTALALAQQRSLRQALSGLLALGLSAGYAAWAGDARAFFLPGIWVDAAYAVALAGSVLIGRPLIGIVHGWLFGRDRGHGREDARVHRAFAVLTLGWAGVYALRAAVQAGLYAADQPELLAVAKLTLGWPLTVAAAGLSLARLRRLTPLTSARTAATQQLNSGAQQASP